MADKIGAARALETLTHWSATDDDRDAIHRSFKFADFATAWAFMSSVATRAEKLDHHPEWSNVYNTVDVVLTTHDADGVTSLDLELAGFMDTLSGKLA